MEIILFLPICYVIGYMVWSSIIDLYDFYNNSLPFEICFLSILFGCLILGIMSAQYFNTLLVWIGLETSAIFGFGIHRVLSEGLFAQYIRELRRDNKNEELWQLLRYRHEPRTQGQLQIINIFNFIMFVESFETVPIKEPSPKYELDLNFTIPKDEWVIAYLNKKLRFLEKIKLIQNPMLIFRYFDKYLEKDFKILKETNIVIKTGMFEYIESVDECARWYGNCYGVFKTTDSDIIDPPYKDIPRMFTIINLKTHPKKEYFTWTDNDILFLLGRGEELQTVDDKFIEKIKNNDFEWHILYRIKQKIFGVGDWKKKPWEEIFRELGAFKTKQIVLRDFI